MEVLDSPGGGGDAVRTLPVGGRGVRPRAPPTRDASPSLLAPGPDPERGRGGHFASRVLAEIGREGLEGGAPSGHRTGVGGGGWVASGPAAGVVRTTRTRLRGACQFLLAATAFPLSS